MRNFLVLTLLIGAVWVVFRGGSDLDTGYLKRQMRLNSDSINDRVNRQVNGPM